HLSFGVDRIALLKGGPQALVAHDDRVEHRVSVEGELILAQNPELARSDNSSLLGLKLSAEQLHEGRLACAVGSGQAVAPPRGKRSRDLFEQNLGAVAHGYIAD